MGIVSQIENKLFLELVFKKNSLTHFRRKRYLFLLKNHLNSIFLTKKSFLFLQKNKYTIKSIVYKNVVKSTIVIFTTFLLI